MPRKLKVETKPVKTPLDWHKKLAEIHAALDAVTANCQPEPRQRKRPLLFLVPSRDQKSESRHDIPIPLTHH